MYKFCISFVLIFFVSACSVEPYPYYLGVRKGVWDQLSLEQKQLIIDNSQYARKNTK